jgi:putative copper resistance protein D
LDGLAPIDGWALLAILAKAAGYAAALVAMGGPLFVAVFRFAPDDVLRLARKLAVIAALLGLAVLALRSVSGLPAFRAWALRARSIP